MSILTLIPYIKDTRRFGHTYIHVAIRKAIHGWQGIEGTIDGQAVIATFCGYGRSLQAGGHKYKAHLRYKATGKPVPSKQLSLVQAV